MRLIHTSDWHLGLQLHGVSLLEEQRRLAGFLIETVREAQADAVLISGDLFDRAVASPEAIRLYSGMMESLCMGCRVPVLVCAGNHDGAARLSSCAPLMRSSGLYMAGSLSDGVAPVSIGDAVFYLLPYFNAEEARYLYPDREIENMADAMEAVCDEIRAVPTPGKKRILLAHCYVAGGETGESDRSAILGGAGRIPPSAFAGFDYVALGHLHRAQQFPLPGGGLARYSGTPYPYAFSEAGQEKSFTLLDTDTMALSAVPVTAGRRLRILHGPFEKLLELAPWDQRRDDYIKAKLTDCTPGLERNAMLREHYPNLLLVEGLLPAVEGGTDSLTAQDLEAMSPRDLVTRFCEEIGGMTPDEELLTLFEREAAALDRGDTE